MRRIHVLGAPMLRDRAAEVDLEKLDQYTELLEEMEEILRATRGVGLAAPQLGESVRIFMFRNPESKELYTLINPVVDELYGEQVRLHEGCLSVPTFYATIPRFESVKATAYNDRGEQFTGVFSGIEAQAFQHEMDHLEGTLFFDHASPYARNRILTRWRKNFKSGATYLPRSLVD